MMNTHGHIIFGLGAILLGLGVLWFLAAQVKTGVIYTDEWPRRIIRKDRQPIAFYFGAVIGYAVGIVFIVLGLYLIFYGKP